MIKLVLILVLLSGSAGLSWPVEGRVTSGYGPRWGRVHDGIDISANEGTWVRAAGDGLVLFAGEYGRYGNLVTVRHSNGVKAFYGHLKNFCVFKNQRVKQGQKIGRVGSTGRSTGPHLHFEIRINRKAQDPLGLLPPISLVDQPGAQAAADPP